MSTLSATLPKCWFLCVALLGLPQAQAQNAPAPYGCSVVLPASLDFGPYRFSQGVTLVSSLSVTCSADGPARPLTVRLSSNLYPQGQSPALVRGSDQLRYDLYIGQDRVRFGSSAASLTFDFSGTSRPAPLTLPLLGQIPSGQWKPAGRYQGELEVTLSFIPAP